MFDDDEEEILVLDVELFVLLLCLLHDRVWTSSYKFSNGNSCGASRKSNYAMSCRDEVNLLSWFAKIYEVWCAPCKHKTRNIVVLF